MAKKIVIDVGYSVEPGVSDNNIVEKDWIKKNTQYMIRMTDESVLPAERLNRILNAYGDNSDVIVVSNYINVGWK